MRPGPDPNRFNESLNEARQRATVMARDAQERVGQLLRETRENQERALTLARQRAEEAQELARRAAEAMPHGLLVRLASSVVGIPLLLLLVFFEGSPQYPALLFTFAVAVCAVVGGWEYFRGLRYRAFRPSEGPAYVAIVLLQFAQWIGSFTQWNVNRENVSTFLPGIIALLVIGTLIHQILRRDPEPLTNVGVTFLGVIYVGWLFSYLIFLRALPGHANIGNLDHLASGPLAGTIVGKWVHDLAHAARGTWIVLYVFAVTWSTDAGAYFFGMRFGKKRLAPRLSPKKTVEGAVGGLITAMVVSLVWGMWIGLPWYHCLLLGPTLGALGQVGDLCASSLKRDMGIKDFGGLLPGHGGILDRFDSLLFTAPIAYYYLYYLTAFNH